MAKTSRASQTAQNLNELSTTDAAQSLEMQLRDVLIKAGFAAAVLAMLTPAEQRSIAEIAGRPAPNLDLIKRMVNGVGAESSIKTKKLVGIMKDYRGKPVALNKLLDVMGTDNPFTATSAAEVRILWQEPGKTTQTTKSRKVVSVLGQDLTGTVYCVYNPVTPTAETYISGIDAFKRIFSAFCPERISSERRKRTEDRRSATLREELRNLTIEDLVADENLAGDTGSRLIVRNLEVYKALREAISECQRRIGELTYSGSMLLSGTESLRVAADPGAQLFNWLKEHILHNENVPKGILLAYEEIIDPDVTLTPEEERNYIRGLIAYQRNNTYISKSLVFSGLLSDLQVHSSLPTDDPFRLNSAIEEARVKVGEEVSRVESDMTLNDFGNYLALSGMAEFRETMNTRILDLYREDFKNALEMFKFVSFENGKWRDDISGDSVPMTRLRQHLYGSKLGYKAKAVLQQKDFKHVVEAQRLMCLIPDEKRALNAMPILKFREMVEGVVVAHRKARFIDQALERYLRTPQGVNITVDRENVGDALQSWKENFPYEHDYRPQELRAPKENNATLLRGLTVSEIVDRFLDQKDTIISGLGASVSDMLLKWSFEIKQLAPLGLYNPVTEPFWERVEPSVQLLVPAKEYSVLLDRAVSILANPLVVDPGLARGRVGASKYVYQHSIKVAQALVALEKEINDASKLLRAELPELAARRQSISSVGTIYCGGRRPSENGKASPYLRWLSVTEFLGAVITEKPEEHIKITYYNAQRLKDALVNFEERFLKGDTISRDWVEKAKRICSSNGSNALVAAGMAPVDRETFLCVNQMSLYGYDYVSKEFYTLIDGV